jgi:hypothetical protein
MSVGLSPFGNAIIVGYVDEPDGSMRVRIAGNRADLHTHVDDEASKERVRWAWDGGGHVFTTVEPDALCLCPPVDVTP